MSIEKKIFLVKKSSKLLYLDYAKPPSIADDNIDIIRKNVLIFQKIGVMEIAGCYLCSDISTDSGIIEKIKLNHRIKYL